jgi:hypothetical protein
MNQSDELLTHFENLPRINPSENWKKNLNLKLSNARLSTGNKLENRIVMIFLLVLVAGNVLAFTNFKIKQHSSQTRVYLKDIASEFLVSTESSKY